MKTTNLLIALVNLLKIENGFLSPFYENDNRINSQGITLEYLVKDIFCNSLSVEGKDEKDQEHQHYLSYIGNQSNPPDFIIRKNEAVEVKKINSPRSGIALNSSYPKAILKCDNTRITRACRECESEYGGWTKKDVIYCIGTVKTETINRVQTHVLKNIWFVYGNCYAASEEYYLNPFNQIKLHIEETGEALGGMTATNELGKLNRIDPLGITDLRVRGMWHIQNPSRAFSYLYVIDDQSKTPVIALMLKTKFDEIYERTPDDYKALLKTNYSLSIAKIKNPDNPAQNLEAVAIRGTL